MHLHFHTRMLLDRSHATGFASDDGSQREANEPKLVPQESASGTLC
jgi:hypothetical protein